MGGSGGGGTFSSKSPAQLIDMVRKAEQRSVSAAFSADVARLLGELLSRFNERDSALVNDRLSELKDYLSDTLEGSFDQFFGGSVAKHTYVDGLSDIDSLVVISDSSLDGKPPSDALSQMTKTLSNALGSRANVSHGQMAVTVDYADGMSIQLLPALKSADGAIRVPSSRTEGWSAINPESFQSALTRSNQASGGKLVPTIKLVKAIVGQLPESQRPSGYHLESLAIEAFKDYSGERTPSAMLPHFFDKAKGLVLTPILDRTGQSVHVDDYLGPASSEARQALGHVLGRLGRRLTNATAAESIDQWKSLFGDGK